MSNCRSDFTALLSVLDIFTKIGLSIVLLVRSCSLVSLHGLLEEV